MSVCGTGTRGLPTEAFLETQPGSHRLWLPAACPRPSQGRAAAAPSQRATLLAPHPRRTRSSARGHGISTVCPSPTPRGLGLGPTNPTRMSLPSEPSGFRWADFPSASRYSCRHSHSSALHRGSPHGFSARTTLPYRSQTPPSAYHPAASGRGLSPATLSAQRHSTSELLRTLSRMAASKPTSWLSSRRHLVCHSATTSGP